MENCQMTIKHSKFRFVRTIIGILLLAGIGLIARLNPTPMTSGDHFATFTGQSQSLMHQASITDDVILAIEAIIEVLDEEKEDGGGNAEPTDP